jgi:hypothetical protein
MRKFFAVALGSVVALAGFAGTANASATVDLIWIDNFSDTACMKPIRRDCPRLGTTLPNLAGPAPWDEDLVASDNMTLLVLLTAGDGGSIGGTVSVDYGDLIPSYSVTDFKGLLTKPPGQRWLTFFAGDWTNQPPIIDAIGAIAAPTISNGLGLPPGGSAYLGTVSFHKELVVNGTFEIEVGVFGPGGTDGILDGEGTAIAPTTTFNSAYLVNVPEPGALSLLVMGVGGMLLAGRGRRS